MKEIEKKAIKEIEKDVIKAAPKVTETGEAAALKSVDQNKLQHIFDNPQHDLNNFAAKFGSREEAFNALQAEVQKTVELQSITGVYETTVTVAGENVTIRGVVINGVAQIGTAFK